MRPQTYTDSKQGLAQACDLLHYAHQAKQRMAEARRKISLPGYLWVLIGLISFVLILVVARKDQLGASVTRADALPANVSEVRRASLVVPEVRRASYVIGAQYNIGTEQTPFNVVFRGAKASIDALMRVPKPLEGDMYWVSATGHCWFLTRVGSTHRLSWVDP
jgi:hypothetical protein